MQITGRYFKCYDKFHTYLRTSTRENMHGNILHGEDMCIPTRKGFINDI